MCYLLVTQKQINLGSCSQRLNLAGEMKKQPTLAWKLVRDVQEGSPCTTGQRRNQPQSWVGGQCWECIRSHRADFFLPLLSGTHLLPIWYPICHVNSDHKPISSSYTCMGRLLHIRTFDKNWEWERWMDSAHTFKMCTVQWAKTSKLKIIRLYYMKLSSLGHFLPFKMYMFIYLLKYTKYTPYSVIICCSEKKPQTIDPISYSCIYHRIPHVAVAMAEA